MYDLSDPPSAMRHKHNPPTPIAYKIYAHIFQWSIRIFECNHASRISHSNCESVLCVSVYGYAVRVTRRANSELFNGDRTHSSLLCKLYSYQLQKEHYSLTSRNT